MRIPRYWAEAHRQRRSEGRQLTVRRFGWSDESLTDAERHAQERVEEALEQAWAGRDVPRREPKVPYNGAEGVPIREEIVAEHGSTIITRNSYGALCLNTPDVLFADIDFPARAAWADGCAFVLLVSAAIAGFIGLRGMIVVWFGVSFLLAVIVLWIYDMVVRGRYRPEPTTFQRLRRFSEANPSWQLRVYRTPNGFRLLAMHDVFDPTSEEATALFKAIESDPIYVAMCRRQSCFRARVSPKPWRIDMPGDIKPRPGVWPIAEDRLPERRAWIAEYEQAARGYAACEYVTTLGFGPTHPKPRAVQELHDGLCRATSGLPIA